MSELDRKLDKRAAAAKSRALLDQRLEQGFAIVSVWVPRENISDITELADIAVDGCGRNFPESED